MNEKRQKQEEIPLGYNEFISLCDCIHDSFKSNKNMVSAVCSFLITWKIYYSLEKIFWLRLKKNKALLQKNYNLPIHFHCMLCVKKTSLLSPIIHREVRFTTTKILKPFVEQSHKSKQKLSKFVCQLSQESNTCSLVTNTFLRKKLGDTVHKIM